MHDTVLMGHKWGWALCQPGDGWTDFYTRCWRTDEGRRHVDAVVAGSLRDPAAIVADLEATWTITRMDDHGTVVIVTEGLRGGAAHQLYDTLVARGHKQTYELRRNS